MEPISATLTEGGALHLVNAHFGSKEQSHCLVSSRNRTMGRADFT